ncbi:MAG: hypothetical protein ACE5G8_17200, partial [Anaerolineae bacterium]
MSFNSHTKPGQLRQKQNWLSRTLLLAPFLLLLVIALGPRAQAQQPDPEPTPVPLTVEKTPAQGKTDGPKSGQASRANALQSTVPTSTTIELQVQDYYTGDPITDYQFLVNVDNTGDPIGDDPNKMSSTTPMASHSPVVLTGVVTPTIAAGYTFTLPDPPAGDADKYLVTVRAGGYKLGGEHIKVIDGFPTNPTTVVVELIPHPLPLSKIRVHVFHDNHPVNGENDVPVEQGLEGFHVSVHDTAGEVTVDWWGNPLCTRYDGVPPNNPQPDPFCQTDASGDLVIDNLPRGKYEVIVIPPDGSDWVQTPTIDGTPVIDAWIEEG